MRTASISTALSHAWYMRDATHGTARPLRSAHAPGRSVRSRPSGPCPVKINQEEKHSGTLFSFSSIVWLMDC